MSVSIIGGSVSPSTALSLNAQTGTTYTFVLTDSNNTLVTASNASAQTYSIPTNANVAFPIGAQINIIAIGAGQVTINAVTSVQQQFYLMQVHLLLLNCEHSTHLPPWLK
jgi:hypothetical protein